LSTTSTSRSAEHFDVLIVGAGISGIGAAFHLTQQCPERSFVVLESHASFGGTWHIHTYPGIRSDSDLYTFGYRFKPWTGPPIATREQILRYLGEVIDEGRLAPHIRYQHRILLAAWSSQDDLWTVTAERGDSGGLATFTCSFLWMCQGYYRHSQGYTPPWEGMEDFRGRIVHPQRWPEDLDYAGKRIVVIGSGATAATLVPALAERAQHVTMLQRSPTYFFTGPNRNELVEELRGLEVDESWIHEIARRRALKVQNTIASACVRQPEDVKKLLIAGVRQHLPPGYDVEKHFTPRYRPWQQRIAFVPNADLFQGISSGKASVVTDEIVRFNAQGIELRSGETLEADLVITATGFDLSILGDIEFTVDGVPLDLSQTVTYRGMMFTGVPNLLWIFGYFRASWTLRVDLLGDFVCRLLAHMHSHGYRRVEVALRPEDEAMPLGPWIDPDNFNPNYLARSMHLLPRRGDKPEWQHTQDYWRERDELPAIDLKGSEFRYG